MREKMALVEALCQQARDLEDGRAEIFLLPDFSLELLDTIRFGFCDHVHGKPFSVNAPSKCVISGPTYTMSNRILDSFHSGWAARNSRAQPAIRARLFRPMDR